MRRSINKTSSDRTSELGHVFSLKRYFVNNLDSYHGEYIVKSLSKVLEKKLQLPSSTTSQTILGEDVSMPPSKIQQPYEIIGTVLDPNIEKKGIENVARIVPKAECLQQLLSCGTVILDIGCDRDELKLGVDYVKLLNDLLERHKDNEAASTDLDNDGDVAPGESKKRCLILISTVLTWACTKPLDPETPDLPFVESDFRKRKAHPNYKMHYDVENEVLLMARKYKSQINAIVVAPGVTYGGKEDIFFYWFQKAWECEKCLPLLGRGSNFIPIINVQDLANIIYKVVVNFPKKTYLLAVEQNATKQREIIKPLGRLIGTGMFKCIPPEEAFLIPAIDQRIYDCMTLNLSMEPTYIVETMNLEWVSQEPFADNVRTLMKQFKKERGLRAFKVVVYGPPIVGKTTLSKQICENYGLLYVSPETVVKDLLEDLAWRVAHWEVGETADLGVPIQSEDEAPIQDDDDDDQGVNEEEQEAAKQTLNLLSSGQTLTEEQIMGFLRQRLLSREATNKGWVLDGFPTSIPECIQLFDKGDDADSEAGEDTREEPFDEDLDMYNSVLKKLLPDIVVSLNATDEFICEKAMRQPEDNSRLDEETILKRLRKFRAGDAREVTPLNFFDELDIHPLVVHVTDPTDYGMKESYAAVTLRMGRPCRYGSLLAIIEANEKKEKIENDSRRFMEAKALKEMEDKMNEEREEKMEYWSELYSMIREEEESALAAAGEPLRNYLVRHIFPTLTPGLLEVAKLRPDDPIDYLAEYLFKLNPSGKMLEPGFNLQGERLLGKIKLLDEALHNLDVKIDPLIPADLNMDDSHVPKKSIPTMNAL